MTGTRTNNIATLKFVTLADDDTTLEETSTVIATIGEDADNKGLLPDDGTGRQETVAINSAGIDFLNLHKTEKLGIKLSGKTFVLYYKHANRQASYGGWLQDGTGYQQDAKPNTITFIHSN